MVSVMRIRGIINALQSDGKTSPSCPLRQWEEGPVTAGFIYLACLWPLVRLLSPFEHRQIALH